MSEVQPHCGPQGRVFRMLCLALSVLWLLTVQYHLACVPELLLFQVACRFLVLDFSAYYYL